MLALNKREAIKKDFLSHVHVQSHCSSEVVGESSVFIFIYLFFIIHMCTQCLGHFSPLPPLAPLPPTVPPPSPPRYPAETILFLFFNIA
jgi:hypothetical protein